MSKRLFLTFILSLCVAAWLMCAGAAQAAVPTSQAQVQLSYAPVVKRTAPAVVNIYTRKTVQQRVASPFMNDPFFQYFFGGDGMPQGPSRQRLEQSLGSGVIVRPDGLIVTSNHVVAGANEITVVLTDRREFEARILSTDKRSDLAVLRIDPKRERLPYLEMKDSDDVEVGDLVLAIGNPFGVGQTVTSGIVSAMARTSLDINDINYYIQTDAAINPGNSGGALVSMDGRLIGINTAIYSRDGGNMGLGFAVPSNMVRSVINNGHNGAKVVARAWTGITGQPVTADMAITLGLAKPFGVLINALHPASPAGKAGLKIGDALLSINGKEIEDPAAFAYRIATLSIGSEVEVEFVRSSRKQIMRFKLIAPPEVPSRDETAIKGQNPLAGAKVANLSPAVVEQYGLREMENNAGGVVVVDVVAGSTAARIGLQRGDIVLKLNAFGVASVGDLKTALDQSPNGWRLTIKRGGQVLTVMMAG